MPASNGKSVFTLEIHVKELNDHMNAGIFAWLEAVGILAESYAKMRCRVDTGLLRNSIAHAVSGATPSIGSGHMGSATRKSRTYKADKSDENGEIKRGTYTAVAPKATKNPCVYVGTNVYYAPYVEMGHRQNFGQFVAKLGKRLVASFVKAYPFIRPAFTEHLSEYEEMLGQYMQQAAEDFNDA